MAGALPGQGWRAAWGGKQRGEAAGSQQVMHRPQGNKQAKMAVFHGRKAQSCWSMKLVWAMPKACGAFCARAAGTCSEGECGVPLELGTPRRGAGWPLAAAALRAQQLLQECEMLPHMQLPFILQSFFFFFSVFPTHVLLPESILIMHDFLFFF